MITFNIGSDGDRWVETDCPVCHIDMDYEPDDFPKAGETWRCPVAKGGCAGREVVPEHIYTPLFAPRRCSAPTI